MMTDDTLAPRRLDHPERAADNDSVSEEIRG
jgi:hypothetical protein